MAVVDRVVPASTTSPTSSTSPWPGLAVALVIAAGATGLGLLVPVIGGPVFGILLGIVLGTFVPGLRSTRLAPGYTLASKKILQLSIVVLGAGLSLSTVVQVGTSSLPVMLGTLAVALGGAYVLGRLLGVRGDTQLLIGVGTGICGASAIAATTAVIGAERSKVAYAIGTIFTFNIAAVLLFGPVGHLLGLSQHAFGLWAGTAINDTSSVVAAAVGYGSEAGGYGIVVKLSRALMLVPIVLVLAWRRRSGERVAPHKVVPVFLVGFLLASLLNTLGLVPASWHAAIGVIGTFLITMALAGIGLGMRPADLRAAGPRPLLLGGLLWLLVASSSLGLQALTGQL
jgi:uncharacterized integral membrane protein (TIGR00698 family)